MNKKVEEDTGKIWWLCTNASSSHLTICTGPVLLGLQGQEAKHAGRFLTGEVGELDPNQRPMICLAVSWDFGGRKQEV